MGDQLLRYLSSLGFTPRNSGDTDLPVSLHTRLHALFHQCAVPTLLRHSILKRFTRSIEFSINYPSPTPFGLSLGPDLPWVDEPSPGNLGFSAGEILTPLSHTYTGILTSMLSSLPSGLPSLCMERSPTHVYDMPSFR